MPVTVHRWQDLEPDHPMAKIDRRRVNGAHAMLSHLVLHEGLVVPVHAHANEQFVILLDGHLRFTVEDPSPRTFDLRSGEVLFVPSNVPHGVTAIVTTTVVDVFAPPSETTGVDAAG